jgi:hypothetical protein
VAATSSVAWWRRAAPRCRVARLRWSCVAGLASCHGRVGSLRSRRGSAGGCGGREERGKERKGCGGGLGEMGEERRPLGAFIVLRARVYEGVGATGGGDQRLRATGRVARIHALGRWRGKKLHEGQQGAALVRGRRGHRDVVKGRSQCGVRLWMRRDAGLVAGIGAQAGDRALACFLLWTPTGGCG